MQQHNEVIFTNIFSYISLLVVTATELIVFLSS